MTEPDSYKDLIQRVRAGDEAAAADLVRRYEPLIRREVRLRLDDMHLQRALDSVDVAQSVLASFFLRAAAGQYDLDQPEQLLRLLTRMIRNKVISAARHQHRRRRDGRRIVGGTEMLAQVAGNEPSPGNALAGRELLTKLRQSLSSEERLLVDLRTQGLAWTEIANRQGGSAQARRMQLARAIDRVVKEMGLDSDGHE